MKTLKFIGMAVVAMVMTLVVASCGNDGDSNSSNGPAETKDTTPVYVYLQLDVPQTAEFLNYFAMTVECNDGTSTTKEDVSQPAWKKTLKLKLPATVTVNVDMKQKTTEDLSQNDTDLTFNPTSCGCKYILENASGESIDGKTNSEHSLTAKSIAKVSAVAANLSDINMNKHYTFKFDKNGKLTIE